MEEPKDSGTNDIAKWLDNLDHKQEDNGPIKEEIIQETNNEIPHEDLSIEEEPPIYEKEKDEEESVENVAGDVPDTLPKGLYAHFLLINISGYSKDIRGLPRCFAIEKTRTLIGKYIKSHVRLDDPDTIQSKHAKVTYEILQNKGKFVLYPLGEATVMMNGKMVSPAGVTLKNGDIVSIGSAELVFFIRDVHEDHL